MTAFKPIHTLCEGDFSDYIAGGGVCRIIMMSWQGKLFGEIRLMHCGRYLSSSLESGLDDTPENRERLFAECERRYTEHLEEERRFNDRQIHECYFLRNAERGVQLVSEEGQAIPIWDSPSEYLSSTCVQPQNLEAASNSSKLGGLPCMDCIPLSSRRHLHGMELNWEMERVKIQKFLSRR